MATVTIVIDEETAESLRRIAELEKRSEADIVRTALAAYATSHPRPQGIGKYRSGAGDVSANARELIRKDVQDGKWP
jgi:Ribbon-helix-helix protein, copG family